VRDAAYRSSAALNSLTATKPGSGKRTKDLASVQQALREVVNLQGSIPKDVYEAMPQGARDLFKGMVADLGKALDALSGTGRITKDMVAGFRASGESLANMAQIELPVSNFEEALKQVGNLSLEGDRFLDVVRQLSAPTKELVTELVKARAKMGYFAEEKATAFEPFAVRSARDMSRALRQFSELGKRATNDIRQAFARQLTEGLEEGVVTSDLAERIRALVQQVSREDLSAQALGGVMKAARATAGSLAKLVDEQAAVRHATIDATVAIMDQARVMGGRGGGGPPRSPWDYGALSPMPGGGRPIRPLSTTSITGFTGTVADLDALRQNAMALRQELYTIPPAISRIIALLSSISEGGAITTERLTQLKGIVDLSDQGHIRFGQTLQELSTHISQVVSQYEIYISAQRRARIEAGEILKEIVRLKWTPKALMPEGDEPGLLSKPTLTSYVSMLAQIQKLSEGAGTISQKTIQDFMSTVRHLGTISGAPVEEVNRLIDSLASLSEMIVEADTASRHAAAEGLRPFLDTLRQQVEAVKSVSPEMSKYIASLTKASAGEISKKQLTTLLQQASIATQAMTGEIDEQAATIMSSHIPAIEALIGSFKRLLEEQKANALVRRGSEEYTLQEINRFRIVRSIFQGGMVGLSILNRSFRMLAFNMVFLETGMYKLTLAVGALTVAVGLLYSGIVLVVKAVAALAKVAAMIVAGPLVLMYRLFRSILGLIPNVVHGLGNLAKRGLQLVADTAKGMVTGAYEAITRMSNAVINVARRIIGAGISLLSRGMAKIAEITKKGLTEITRKAADVEVLTNKISAFTKTLADARQGSQFFAEQSMLTGFAIDDLSDAWLSLARANIGQITPEMWQATLNMAAGAGRTAAEAAEAITGAIGEQGAALTSLREWGVRATEADNERLTSMGRLAAAQEISRRVNDKFTGSLARQSMTFDSLIARIGATWNAIKVTLGAPILNDVVIPLLATVTNLTQEVYFLVRAFVEWLKVSGIWNSALQVWKDTLNEFLPTARELFTVFKMGVILALYAAVAAFKLLGYVVRYVTQAIAGLWSWVKKWVTSNKVLSDSLRQMAQALKEMDWAKFVQGAKDMIANMPDALKKSLLQALGGLATILAGPLLLLGARLIGMIVDGMLTGTWGDALTIVGLELAGLILLGFWKIFNLGLGDALLRVIEGIGEDITSGRFAVAAIKVGQLLLTSLFNGIVLAVTPPSKRNEINEWLRSRTSEMFEGIENGPNDPAQFQGFAKRILTDVIDAIKTEGLRTGVAVTVGAVAAALGFPVLGVALTSAMLAALPSSDQINDSLTKWRVTVLNHVLNLLRDNAPDVWAALADFVIPTREGYHDKTVLERSVALGEAVVRAIATAITNALESEQARNIIGAVGDAVVSIFEALNRTGIGAIAGRLATAVGSLIADAFEILATPAVQVMEYVDNMTGEMVTEVTSSGIIGKIGASMLSMLTKVTEFIKGSDLMATYGSMLGEILEGAVDFITAKDASGKSIIGELAKSLLGALGDAIKEAFGLGPDWDLDIMENIGKTLPMTGLAGTSAWARIGRNVVLPFIENIRQAFSWKDAPTPELQAAVDAARGFGVALLGKDGVEGGLQYGWDGHSLKPFIEQSILGAIATLFLTSALEASNWGYQMMLNMEMGVGLAWTSFLLPTLEMVNSVITTLFTTSALEAANWGYQMMLNMEMGVSLAWISFLLPTLEMTQASITEIFTVDLNAFSWGLDMLKHFEEGVSSRLNATLNYMREVGSKIKDAVLSGIGEIVIRPRVDWPNLPNGGVVTNVPAFASGGIVRRPTLAVVGETGPEAIIPLSAMRSNGTSDINIYVTGNYLLDDDQASELATRIADKVDRALMNRVNRSYRIGFVR